MPRDPMDALHDDLLEQVAAREDRQILHLLDAARPAGRQPSLLLADLLAAAGKRADAAAYLAGVLELKALLHPQIGRGTPRARRPSSQDRCSGVVVRRLPSPVDGAGVGLFEVIAVVSGPLEGGPPGGDVSWEGRTPDLKEGDRIRMATNPGNARWERV